MQTDKPPFETLFSTSTLLRVLAYARILDSTSHPSLDPDFVSYSLEAIKSRGLLSSSHKGSCYHPKNNNKPYKLQNHNFLNPPEI